MLACTALTMAACTPVERDEAVYAALETCLEQNVVITGARILAFGSTDMVQVDVTNNLDWTITSALFEYSVFLGSSSDSHYDSRADIAFTDPIESGESLTLLISLYVPEVETNPPYRVEAIVKDVDDTFGLPLVGRARAIARAAARVSQQLCEV